MNGRCNCCEDLGREVAALRDRLEQLEAQTLPEPWLDYRQLARHYSCGVRTMEARKAEGMPMHLLDGKQKGRLSEVQPWLEEHGYLPRPDRGTIAVGSTNGAAPQRRPAPDTGIGGSDVQAA